MVYGTPPFVPGTPPPRLGTGDLEMGVSSSAPRVVEGLEYVSSDLAPGLLMFGCTRLAATLSVKGCAARWAEAKSPPGRRRKNDTGVEHASDQFSACRACPIGAVHSGERVRVYSPFYAAAICPGCRKGTTRMIGDRICVSCYNRRREAVIGRNARGNAPSKLVVLRSVRFRAVAEGKARLVQADAVADLFEPVLQTMRTTVGAVAFAYAAPGPVRRQHDLFSLPAASRASKAVRRGAVRRRMQAPDQNRQGLLF